MSCAKHKYLGDMDGFVHKVVHNVAQSAPNSREVSRRAGAAAVKAGKTAS